MNRCFSEPTIDELMNDTLTQGLMKADGVDVPALKAMLVRLASVIEGRPAQRRAPYIPAADFWASAKTKSSAHECAC